MKQLLILLFISSYATYAQSSVETGFTQDKKASMSSTQRISLQAFESLSVIDTDENKSYVFLNGKWTPEFTDAQISEAKKHREAIKNTNASWKAFDELSKPTQADIPTQNIAQSAPPTSKEPFQSFSYQAISAKEFAKNDFTLQVPTGKQIAFVKLYFNNQTGIQNLTLANTQAQKTLSEKVLTFKYLADSRSPIKFDANVVTNSEVLGVLVGYLE